MINQNSYNKYIKMIVEKHQNPKLTKTTLQLEKPGRYSYLSISTTNKTFR